MMIQEFNYSVDVLKSLLWQYNDSKNLQELLLQKQSWYTLNQTDFWENWFFDVFNLQTANEFGLSVWSIILDVPFYVPFDPEPDDKPIWGFNDNSAFPVLQTTYVNFEWGNFSTRGDSVTLTVEEQRFLLRLRYYQLITRGEVGDINTFLQYLVNTSSINFSGSIYALDALDMSMRYIISGDEFPQDLLDELLRLDVLPRPAGVLISDIVILPANTWGFNDNSNYPVLTTTYLNFDHGNFYSGFFERF